MTHNTDVWVTLRDFARILLCHRSVLKTFTRHGVRSPQLQTDAITIAEAAFDADGKAVGVRASE